MARVSIAAGQSKAFRTAIARGDCLAALGCVPRGMVEETEGGNESMGLPPRLALLAEISDELDRAEYAGVLRIVCAFDGPITFRWNIKFSANQKMGWVNQCRTLVTVVSQRISGYPDSRKVRFRGEKRDFFGTENPCVVGSIPTLPISETP